jgi:hypothetical protein
MKVLVSCTENPIFIIETLDELRPFIDKKVIFSENKIPSVCRLGYKFVSTTSIRITKPI